MFNHKKLYYPKAFLSKTDIGSKYDFDSSKKEFLGKFFLEVALGQIKDGDPDFFAKFEIISKDKINYKNMKDLLSVSKFKNIFKELKYKRSFNEKDLSFTIKLQEKSIKSFITDKNSILSSSSSFDEESKKNIFALSIEKSRNKIILGWLNDIYSSKQGFLSFTKAISVMNSSVNLAIEKWGLDYSLLFHLETLYNSIGIGFKNQLNHFNNFSKIQGSLVTEPMKLFKILLWHWIRDIPERKYLLAFLKQVVLQTVISYEDNEWKFKIILGIRNGLQMHIGKEKLALQKFEMKQTLYSS
jgi:hypothetical protein